MQVKSIERAFKKSVVFALANMRYGTSRPEVVRLPRSDHRLHINPHDESAWKSQVANTLRGHFPLPQRFWRKACAELRPDVAIDAGMNYGECVFSGVYAPGTRVFAFEANETLRPFIERSHAEHNQREQIHLRFGALNDQPGSVRFFIHDASAGSSLAAQQDSDEYEVREVGCVVLDEVIAEHAAGVKSMVMKIDIEGAEARAFAGFCRTLDQLESAVIFSEFSPRMMERVGSDPLEFWAMIQERFSVFAFDRKERLLDLRGRGLADLQPYLKPGLDHTDLLLVLDRGSDAPAMSFVERWAGAVIGVPDAAGGSRN